MKKSRILGVGHFVPERVVTNEDLAGMMDTNNQWIVERTGIHSRHWFTPGVDSITSMSKAATIKALERANVTAEEIDFIVFATITPDYFIPGNGVLLQRELNFREIGALDIRNACSGFIYALSIADQFIKTGMYKKVLVVGAEIQSSALDKSDEGRSSSVIFADGAGAVVLGAVESDQPGILSTHLHSEGKYAEELYCKDPGSSREVRLSPEMLESGSTYLRMNGNAVFKHAVVRFMEVIQEALSHNQLDKSAIDLLVPHQANLRISQYIQQKLEMPDEKVFNNIMHMGNTTAATIPIALSEAWEQGRIKEGDLICLAAFGSGFTWASALLHW
ncbi:MAG TPA: 3-oxoacyl-ACP synthase [Algoriphagus sp.]|jgi:3-oxoacyl-[acyl-carrier-protein] synthase-3|uniref:3-oxoacyl-ACP synthase III family protein n=1 Tax=unclassified Algoriphagus TaxID=2641541 RepID=UPI000C4E0433|nr:MULTISPECIES: beta-ketoacyl-ACP synthase III [unclassified Algoriphagus]MAL14501.1 3-oxoacyl-ACP synthase [Algoriphagus sp.]MAN85320.1 3-oxoacyl-ACP synthase [Algoriphagus sp.]HAS57453.1 3-oxoacyl-ACP synthase [Algoriphagus sp.]HAZ26803.1 3-oxoacyl-ACP synthase [Algoriphagus sp.]HCD89921.1 3-oxoacyl-ACP synthase [Algoriphagus sp.]|tara:strand:- start:1392 stop:2390 length:999 start_codon:yes stop_codon:yes gene_type:complete